jgi:hypothetical protein
MKFYLKQKVQENLTNKAVKKQSVLQKTHQE